MTEPNNKKPVTAGALISALRDSNGLPALDENVSQLCRMTGQHDLQAAELTAVIMRDAGMTSRLLTMSNSVAYRPRVPVKTISSAVVLFGFERIQQMAVGLSLFHKHASTVRDKELYRLLVCAYCSGTLAMHLARCTGSETPEECFVAGLLRQIPRLILANGFPDRYREMERLVMAGECDTETACQRSFGIGFTEIVDAIADYWNLRGADAPGRGESQFATSVRLASDVADMLFGNQPGGPKALKQVSNAVAQHLKQESIVLTELVGSAVAKDPNMTDFFKLSAEDLVMMTRIAEWGKVSASTVAESLTTGFENRTDLETPKDEPLMMAHFLSELTLAVHNRYGFNDVLMMAMEGMFRCMHPEFVIAAFMDRKQGRMTGRLHIGQTADMPAARYQVKLDEEDRLAAENLQQSEPIILPVGAKQITHDDRLFTDHRIDTVLLAPISADREAIGQFCLAHRKATPAFTTDDCLWVSAVASHVGMAFEKLG